ncbi:MAG TPA: NADH-quinone oxidoreductase subunit NuoE [Rhodocyclaceae bacterium]
MLTEQSLKRIDREVAKYPDGQAQSAVMAALAIAQEEKGWLEKDMIEFVANYLKIPAMAAYEVASFYHMYHLEPVGKSVLTVCTCVPCALSGGRHAGEYLKEKLGIGYNETTSDGRFTLKEGECFGTCGDAPLVMVNNRRMCSKMTPEQIDKLIVELP